MVLRFEIFVPATSTFEINRNGLISNNLLKKYENEEQIISGFPIDGAISVRVDSRFGSYRWFVYITTPLLRDASWILILHCGTPEPAQRHLYC